ncbi:hypothetical protein Leryth_020643 [Lithospermum erythrorhizon]|nr:hypothetical protein Leryth_020643 [Lithospermum erythrorhizon]
MILRKAAYRGSTKTGRRSCILILFIQNQRKREIVVPLYAFFGDCENICKAITAGKQRNPSSELVIEEGQRTVVQEHLW